MSDDQEVTRVRLYQDEQGLWRWVAFMAAGLAVQDSEQGWEHWGDCRDAAVGAFPGAELVEG